MTVYLARARLDQHEATSAYSVGVTVPGQIVPAPRGPEVITLAEGEPVPEGTTAGTLVLILGS